eukprot:COSAG02_NODE_5112_length_4618_cov_2.492144_2_plen_124_part_00
MFAVMVAKSKNLGLGAAEESSLGALGVGLAAETAVRSMKRLPPIAIAIAGTVRPSVLPSTEFWGISERTATDVSPTSVESQNSSDFQYRSHAIITLTSQTQFSCVHFKENMSQAWCMKNSPRN